MLSPGSFDLIVSRAVLEHVFDVDTAWASMDTLLAPGGHMLHKVDFRNHGFYTTLHPLGFLMVPEPLWSMVSSPDPTLNRRRMASYEQLAEKSGYDYRVGVTHLSSETDEFVPPRFEWQEGREVLREGFGLHPRGSSPARAALHDDGRSRAAGGRYFPRRAQARRVDPARRPTRLSQKHEQTVGDQCRARRGAGRHERLRAFHRLHFLRHEHRRLAEVVRGLSEQREPLPRGAG